MKRGAGWRVKGVDTQIAWLLCMLLAVMHQSISRPYYYSDYTHTHTLFRFEAEVHGALRGAAETRVTFSIIAGYFELAVNPSQRTGVKGDFLTPVKCLSDLLAGYCNICTLHLFTCVLPHTSNSSTWRLLFYRCC